MASEIPSNFAFSSMLSNLLNSIPYATFCKNRNHNFIALNDLSSELFGFSREEMLGKNDSEFFPKSEYKISWSIDDEVFDTGKIIANKEIVTDAYGIARHVHTEKGRIKTNDGEELLIGILYTSEDRNLQSEKKSDGLNINENTLKSIETLVDSFKQTKSNKHDLDSFNINGISHLLSCDRNFLSEILNRIPYFACYTNNNSNLLSINERLRTFIGIEENFNQHSLRINRTVEELRKKVFKNMKYKSNSLSDEKYKFVTIAGIEYLLLIHQMSVTGFTGMRHGMLHIFDLLLIDENNEINLDYYNKTFKHQEFYSIVKRIKDYFDDPQPCLLNFPIQNTSRLKANSVEQLVEIEFITKQISDKVDDLLKKKGMSFKEWQALNIIVNYSNVTPSTVSKQLRIARTAVSKLLELLEVKGMVERRRQLSDRRTVRLWFTEYGYESWLIGKRIVNRFIQY